MYKYFLISINLIFILNFIACTGIPVISETLTSRMTYVLKGTYETNSPYDWLKIYNNDYINNLPDVAQLNKAVDLKDFNIWIDIAETVISLKQPNQYRDIALADTVNFALQRQVLCSSEKANDNSEIKECQNTNGVGKKNDFFQEGFMYPSSDVPSDIYKSMVVIIRKMITSPSYSYNNKNDETINTSSFDNRVINGTNIRTFYDFSLSDNPSSIFSRFFHLYRNKLNLSIDRSDNPYVLEVRIFIKNLLMKHVRVNNASDLNTRSSFSFIGPSDWLENHDYDNSNTSISNPASNTRLGGTLLLGLRTYFPHEVGSIKLNGFQKVCGTGIKYFTAIPAGDNYEKTILPTLATKVTENSEFINVSPGSYDIYITQDKKMLNKTGEINGEDGFPETHKLCLDNIKLSVKQSLTLDVSQCNCP